jgi:hypothetical protein
MLIKLSRIANMVTGSIYVAVPALAAAVGFYFIGTNHAKVLNSSILLCIALLYFL